MINSEYKNIKKGKTAKHYRERLPGIYISLPIHIYRDICVWWISDIMVGANGSMLEYLLGERNENSSRFVSAEKIGRRKPKEWNRIFFIL